MRTQQNLLTSHSRQIVKRSLLNEEQNSVTFSVERPFPGVVRNSLSAVLSTEWQSSTWPHERPGPGSTLECYLHDTLSLVGRES